MVEEDLERCLENQTNHEKEPSIYLKNIIKIKDWIERQEEPRKPLMTVENEEERKLAEKWRHIKYEIMNPYLRLSAEKKEDYKRKYPEIEEIIKIVNEIVIMTDTSIINLEKIKKWMEEQEESRNPSSISYNITEKRLGNALIRIRHKTKLYLKLPKEEKEKYQQKHPEIEVIIKKLNEIDNMPIISGYLIQLEEIKEWVERQEEPRKPYQNSKDKEENKLAHSWKYIQYKLIKPYLKLSLEEKQKYQQKYPNIDEAVKIVNEINIMTSFHLINLRKIKEWIERQEEPRKPSSISKDKEERKLATKWNYIKCNIIQPYLGISIEKEKEKYKQKYPEIEEIIRMVNEIEIMASTHLINLRKIKEWIRKQEKPKKPSRTSKDKEEKRFGDILEINIKYNLIKPYLELKTEKEKERYRQIHPEIDEVMEMVFDIEENYGDKKRIKLAKLIKIDLEKRENVQEAKQLETRYEKLENIKMNDTREGK